MRPGRLAPLFCAALGAAAVGLSEGHALADGAPKFSSGWWLPVGVSMGGAFRNDLPDGFFIGGELSSAYLWWDGGVEGLWVGALADAVYDFGAEAFRHRIGPEIGWWFLGAEVAYVGEARGGEYRPGISLRASGNVLGILNLYGGYGRTWGSDGGAGYGEFGGLLKLPIPLTADEHPRYPMPEPVAPPYSSYPPGEPLQQLPPGMPPPTPGMPPPSSAPGQPPGGPAVPGQPPCVPASPGHAPGEPPPPGRPPGVPCTEAAAGPYAPPPPGSYATPPPPPP
jgi:hypothetical protein